MRCAPYDAQVEGSIACGETVAGSTDSVVSTLGGESGEHIYTFTMDREGFVQFDSCESSYDTFLRVLSDSLAAEIDGCDDCGNCGLQTVLDSNLPAGDYHLLIEGFASSSGEYSVTMNCLGPDAVDHCLGSVLGLRVNVDIQLLLADFVQLIELQRNVERTVLESASFRARDWCGLAALPSSAWHRSAARLFCACC